MLNRLDELDRRIVALLMDDGRMSSADVARELGDASERTVRYRIDRLVRTGTIHVGAIVNPRALGYAVTGDVWMEVSPGTLSAVTERVAALPEVSYVAHSTGGRDLSIQVYARDNQELHRFVSEVLGAVPGVTRVSTMLVPLKAKDVHQWRIPAEPPVGLRAARIAKTSEGGSP